MSSPDGLPSVDVLYHYTDAEGLKGIVESRTIWATHAGFLNDIAEIEHGKAIFKRDFYPLLGGGFGGREGELWAAMMSHVDERLGHVAWISSFTELNDDLSQWRAYSRRGGYAVGFSLADLRSALNAEDFRLSPCEYDSAPVISSLIGLANRTHLAFEGLPYTYRERLKQENERRATTGIQPMTEAEYMAQLGRDLGNEISDAIAARKHPSFRAEREWRAVRFAACEEVDVQFRTRGPTIVPFSRVPLGPAALPIRAIVASPGLDERTFAGLEFFIRCHAATLPDVEVVRSGSPYTTA